MNTSQRNGKQRKRKRSSDIALDDTIENILEGINDHYKSKSQCTTFSIQDRINSEEHSELSEPSATSQVSSHLVDAPQAKWLKNKADHSSSPEESGELNSNKTAVQGNYITLKKKSLREALKLLSESSKPEKKDKAKKAHLKFSRTCNEGYNHMLDLINWQSNAFAVRVIRNLILDREWEHLKELLRIMLKQHKSLKNYIKELTYLYFMINADRIDPATVEDYFLLCFSTYDKSKKPLREFDIWFKNCEMY